MTITVMTADDEHLVRSGLRMILGTEPGIELVAEAEDGQETLDLVAQHDPDVLLLDILLVEVDADELEPRPSLAHLQLLVDRVRDTGLPVSVSVTGEPRALPPGVDVSAYRIVQEALTNTLKHAGRTTAEVGVVYLPDGVELCVSDRGAPGAVAGTTGTGRGLIGMRERAHLYGGTVEAGPVATGGFLVRAVLPTDGAS